MAYLQDAQHLEEVKTVNEATNFAKDYLKRKIKRQSNVAQAAQTPLS